MPTQTGKMDFPTTPTTVTTQNREFISIYIFIDRFSLDQHCLLEKNCRNFDRVSALIEFQSFSF